MSPSLSRFRQLVLTRWPACALLLVIASANAISRRCPLFRFDIIKCSSSLRISLIADVVGSGRYKPVSSLQLNGEAQLWLASHVFNDLPLGGFPQMSVGCYFPAQREIIVVTLPCAGKSDKPPAPLRGGAFCRAIELMPFYPLGRDSEGAGPAEIAIARLSCPPAEIGTIYCQRGAGDQKQEREKMFSQDR
jgi:hypothetical protein